MTQHKHNQHKKRNQHKRKNQSKHRRSRRKHGGLGAVGAVVKKALLPLALFEMLRTLPKKGRKTHRGGKRHTKHRRKSRKRSTKRRRRKH